MKYKHYKEALFTQRYKTQASVCVFLYLRMFKYSKIGLEISNDYPIMTMKNLIFAQNLLHEKTNHISEPKYQLSN